MSTSVKLDKSEQYDNNIKIVTQWLEGIRQTTSDHQDLEIPDYIITCLSGTLDILTSCVAWCTKSQNLPDASLTALAKIKQQILQKHSELNKMLEGTREKLLGLQIARSRRPGQEDSGNLQIGSVSEAATELNANAHQSVQPQQVIPSLPECYYKCFVTIVIYFLLKDCTELRIIVRNTWQSYLRGKLTLENASLVANASLATIRRLSDDMEKRVKRFKETARVHMHKELVGFLHAVCCYLDVESLPPGLDDAMLLDNLASIDVKDAACSRVARCLGDIQEKHIAGANIYDVIAQTETITTAQSFFFRCLAQLKVLAPVEVDGSEDVRPWIWSRDCVHTASEQILCKKKLKCWMVFAIQILWGTHCTLGTDTEYGVSTLHSVGQIMQARYNEFVDSAPNTIGTEITKLETFTQAGNFQERLY